MAKQEVINYQVQELQMQKGWSQPYFNTYGVSTHDTYAEALGVMNKCIISMNGREKRFNNWSHSYQPSQCFQIMEVKRIIEVEDPEPNYGFNLSGLSSSDLISLRENIDKRIREIEFEVELKSLIERANSNGINTNTLLDSIKS